MKPKLFVLLEDIRSAYNVGSVFRTCDSAGVSALYLTGYTAVPPEPKLHKTALGAIDSVPWEHHCDAFNLVRELQSHGCQVFACEPLPEAKSLYSQLITQDTCLVFGNEVRGISSKVLAQSDGIVSIPQLGSKSSLNIASAAAVVIYEYRRQISYSALH